MLRSDLITLVLAMAAHIGYYAFISSADRAWFAYVATGVLLAWMGWRERSRAGTAVGLFAATYIVIEAAQVAVCGALAWWLHTSPGRDLCVAIGGDSLYAALTSLAVAAAWTWRRTLWPSRQ